MSELGHRLNAEFEKLKTRRDELRVQIDLGKMEARDAWNELDGHWTDVETKMREFSRLSRDAADDVGEAASEVVEDAKIGVKVTAAEVGDAAEKLMDEIRDGFKRLRDMI